MGHFRVIKGSRTVKRPFCIIDRKSNKDLRLVPDKTRYFYATFAKTAEKYRVSSAKEERLPCLLCGFTEITNVPFQVFLGPKLILSYHVLSELDLRAVNRTKTRLFGK